MELETALLAHLRRLSMEIGARRIGSQANQAVADYIREAFLAARLEVEEQPYTCTAWEHTSTRLAVDGKPVPAVANAFSLPCDVTAPFVPVGSTAELEKTDITGKIVLFYGERSA